MMSYLTSYLKNRSGQMVRPWALIGPIVVLLIAIPLSRPIRHPAFDSMSDDEQARLATVQAIVEHHTLAIEGTVFGQTARNTLAIGKHLYSDQPPMLAVLLSGPYWVLHQCGLTFERNSLWVMFLLTLVGVALPVALAAGLVYKMGRLFELQRPARAGLGLAVVLGSGLISYSTVLNAHASAAVLLLGATACLFHVGLIQNAAEAALWVVAGGFCAALAAVIDPLALLFVILLCGVVASFRWKISTRALAVCLYILGAAVPLTVHLVLTRPVTGGGLPTLLQFRSETGPRHLAVSPDDDDDDNTAGVWQNTSRTTGRVVQSLLGGHGIFTHFPVLLIGLAGIGMVMHRHWPSATKMLAGVTVVGGAGILLIFSLSRVDWSNAMFATRWFVLFLPLTLFWSGAWLRRPHNTLAWAVAGLLLAFSITVSIIGATGPWPREGFDRYTAAGAVMNLVNPPAPEVSQPLLARR